MIALLSTLRSGFGAGLFALTAITFAVGCGAPENWNARSPVDEESQVQGSASLEANPPGDGEAGGALSLSDGTDVAVGVNTQAYEDTDPSALTEFRPALEPYGTWEDSPTYGTVWVPSSAAVGPDFVPYVSSGHWTYDDEWVWVSDYSWGWAPFHYGRWVHIPGRGWAWIPGRAYSGAWVTWSYGPAYVGWAPLGPSWYWYGGYPVGVTIWPAPYYVYCPHHSIFAPVVSREVVHGPGAQGIADTTRPFVPANPGVNPVPRVPANPSVNPGTGSAGVNQRVAAKPTVGPTPHDLGLEAHAVVRPPPNGPSGNAGLEKARAFATPSGASKLGGAAPASGAGFTAASTGPAPRYAAGNTAPANAAFARGSSYGAPSAPSSGNAFAARVDNGSRFTPPNAVRHEVTSPTPRSDSNRPVLGQLYGSASPSPYGYSPPRAPSSFAQQAPSNASSPAYAPRAFNNGSTARITSPTYAPPASAARSAPSFSASSAPRAAAPTYSAPSHSAPSAPVYRAPAASAPVYHAAPSAPSPSFHSAAPSFSHSAPAAAPRPAAVAPVARPSAPAPARPSSGGNARRR